jgi:hypothetical protein
MPKISKSILRSFIIVALITFVIICIRGNFSPVSTKKQKQNPASSPLLFPSFIKPELSTKPAIKTEKHTHTKNRRGVSDYAKNKIDEIIKGCWRNFKEYRPKLLELIKGGRDKKVKFFAISEFAKYERDRVYEKFLIKLAKEEEDEDLRIALFEAAKKIKSKNRPPTPFDFRITSEIVEEKSLRGGEIRKFVKIECKTDFYNDVRGVLTMSVGQLKTKKYIIDGKAQKSIQTSVSLTPELQKIPIPCSAVFRDKDGWFYQASGVAEILFESDKDPAIRIRYFASDARGSKNRLSRR